jgi:hypothetical protein
VKPAIFSGRQFWPNASIATAHTLEQSNMTIKKSTLVKIRTWNGGEVCAKLLADYVPTYAATIERPNGGHLVLMAWRIESIEVINSIEAA